MKLQKTFNQSLSAFLFFAFMLSPLQSNEASFNSQKQSFSVHLQVNQEGSANSKSNIDFSVPVSDKKEKNPNNQPNDKIPEAAKGKHHSDEDKHKHHHFNFDRLRTRKKVHTTLLCMGVKILFAVSYFSILLCTYLSVGH